MVLKNIEIKRFFKEIIGIKAENVLDELASNSQVCELKAKDIIAKENEKISEIPFLFYKGGIVKAYYENSKEKNRIHCFAHIPGEPLVGIVNLDKLMKSYLTVEAVTDCEILNTSAETIRRLSTVSVEVALVCNKMQSVTAIREYEYHKVILERTPAQRYEYMVETYPDLIGKVNKKDIASYLNITPECLSRVLRDRKIEE